MKKQAVFLLLTTLLFFATSSVESTEFLAEAKAGYFGPTDHTFRKIYGGGGIYGVEFSVQTWDGLYAWTSGNYFSKTGHSLELNERTKVTLVPIGLGLKYLFNMNCWDFYLGAGALSTYLHTKDHSSFVPSSTSKWGFGGIAKAGILANIGHSFFLDFFGDYSYMKIDFHGSRGNNVERHNANVSGWSAGAALGYRFGCRS